MQTAQRAFCVVSTVDDLRHVDASVYGIVMTAGYHRSGDGGNGLYYAGSAQENAKDNGGTIIVADDGTPWRLSYSGALPLKAFGAVGDGSTDDTAAIQAWLDALKTAGSGYAAAGRYLFTSQLRAPVRDNVSIKGDGPQQTLFVYKGSQRDIDLFVVGDETAVTHGWLLEGFNIDSGVTMTGGAALRLNNLKHTATLRDVSFSTINGLNGKNLWDGVWFNNCSTTTYTGFEIYVQNEGITVNGLADSDSGADLLLDQGSITFSNIGIHLAGGYGGLYVGQVLIYGCGQVGYLQDNARAARGNREVIISDLCVLDACHEYCALIDDKQSLQCVMQFNAFISGAGWIPPACPGDGLLIRNMPQGRLSVGSNHIKHNTGNGITLEDDTVTLRIAPTTYIVGNGGWGLYAAKPTSLVNSQACFMANKLGDVSPLCVDK